MCTRSEPNKFVITCQGVIPHRRLLKYLWPIYRESTRAMANPASKNLPVDSTSTSKAVRIVNDVMNSMEQGIIVWSADGFCELHNDRVFAMLELEANELYVGLSRVDFLRMAVKRGEFTQDIADKATDNFESRKPFSFSRVMPSGREIITTARARSSGGFVVTFSDITELKEKEVELEESKRRAEVAEGELAVQLQNLIVDKAELEQQQTLLLNAREQELQKRKEAALLSEFNGWLQSTSSLSELFEVVSAFLQQLLPHSRGSLYLYANSRDVLEGVCSWNNGKMLKNFEPPDCWALRRGRSYYYGENTVDFPCHHVQASHAEAVPERHYCLPIIAHGNTVGLLCIELEDGASTANEQDTRELCNFCGEQISLSIANAQMREQLLDQSMRDALTSLYNRRYFIECVRRELANPNNTKLASIISFDVDNFKKFNDTHGHDAGDTVLRAMSEVLVRSFRGSDTPCRYGGEEFAVFMPGASASIACQRAEELRVAVENEVVRYSGEELKITISSGVATFPNNGNSVQSLVKSADKALYEAKNSGRNNVKHIDDINEP